MAVRNYIILSIKDLSRNVRSILAVAKQYVDVIMWFCRYADDSFLGLYHLLSFSLVPWPTYE